MSKQGLSRRAFIRTGGAAAGAGFSMTRPAMADTGFAKTLTTQFRLNGRSMSASHEARVSLLDLLREHLQVTGTKKCCNEGACGACTVLLDGLRINACMTLAACC